VLKLTLKREAPIEPPPLSGQRIGFELETSSGVWLTDVWADLVVPAHGWQYVDRIERCNKGAASLLHALELGIASAARWIAVELLKDPTPSAEDEQVVPGSLWLEVRFHELSDGRTETWSTLCSQGEFLGAVNSISRGAIHLPGSWEIDGYRDEREFASQEQALAVLIEHATPWIAVALEKEIEND
jgi:hypothetical protein